MAFRITSIIRHSERDDFENGYEPDTSVADYPQWDTSAPFATPEALVAWIKRQTGEHDISAFSFDSCEEPGRIDVQFNAIAHGSRAATAAHIEQWKVGKASLRCVNVSFYAQEISAPATALWAVAQKGD